MIIFRADPLSALGRVVVKNLAYYSIYILYSNYYITITSTEEDNANTDDNKLLLINYVL